MDQRNIKAFWDWFVVNAHTLRAETGAGRADLMYEAVSKIHDQLGVLVADEVDDEVEVLFTAYGDPEIAPLVIGIVNAAPEAPGWRFVAFTPPAREPFVHERSDGVAVDSESVRFEPLESPSQPNSIGIRFYLPMRVLKHTELDDILRCLLMTAAGESLACHVEHTEARALDKATDDATFPLRDLEKYLQWKVARSIS